MAEFSGRWGGPGSYFDPVGAHNPGRPHRVRTGSTSETAPGTPLAPPGPSPTPAPAPPTPPAPEPPAPSTETPTGEGESKEGSRTYMRDVFLARTRDVIFPIGDDAPVENRVCRKPLAEELLPIAKVPFSRGATEYQLSYGNIGDSIYGINFFNPSGFAPSASISEMRFSPTHMALKVNFTSLGWHNYRLLGETKDDAEIWTSISRDSFFDNRDGVKASICVDIEHGVQYVLNVYLSKASYTVNDYSTSEKYIGDTSAPARLVFSSVLNTEIKANDLGRGILSFDIDISNTNSAYGEFEPISNPDIDYKFVLWQKVQGTVYLPKSSDNKYRSQSITQVYLHPIAISNEFNMRTAAPIEDSSGHSEVSPRTTGSSGTSSEVASGGETKIDGGTVGPSLGEEKKEEGAPSSGSGSYDLPTGPPYANIPVKRYIDYQPGFGESAAASYLLSTRYTIGDKSFGQLMHENNSRPSSEFYDVLNREFRNYVNFASSATSLQERRNQLNIWFKGEGSFPDPTMSVIGGILRYALLSKFIEVVRQKTSEVEQLRFTDDYAHFLYLLNFHLLIPAFEACKSRRDQRFIFYNVDEQRNIYYFPVDDALPYFGDDVKMGMEEATLSYDALHREMNDAFTVPAFNYGYGGLGGEEVPAGDGGGGAGGVGGGGGGAGGASGGGGGGPPPGGPGGPSSRTGFVGDPDSNLLPIGSIPTFQVGKTAGAANALAMASLNKSGGKMPLSRISSSVYDSIQLNPRVFLDSLDLQKRIQGIVKQDNQKILSSALESESGDDPFSLLRMSNELVRKYGREIGVVTLRYNLSHPLPLLKEQYTYLLKKSNEWLKLVSGQQSASIAEVSALHDTYTKSQAIIESASAINSLKNNAGGSDFDAAKAENNQLTGVLLQQAAQYSLGGNRDLGLAYASALPPVPFFQVGRFSDTKKRKSEEFEIDEIYVAETRGPTMQDVRLKINKFPKRDPLPFYEVSDYNPTSNFMEVRL